MDDMDQFKDIFLEESFENLAVMESELLTLNVEAYEHETINTIFRAMHSIKGGSGMFGFSAINQFTHLAETLLDEVRSDKRPLTQAIIELLLRSVDIVKEMLENSRSGDLESFSSDATEAIQMLRELLENKSYASEESVLHERPPAVVSEKTVKVVQETESKTPAASTNQGAFLSSVITYTPPVHAFSLGSDPLLLIYELSRLGSIQSTLAVDAIPPFLKINPTECHVGWRIEADPKIGRSDIDEIFSWCSASECTIQGDFVPEPELEPIEETPSVDPEPIFEEPLPVSLPEEPEKKAATPHVEKSTGLPKKESTQATVVPKVAPEAASIRVSTEKLDGIINLVGELVITQSMVAQLGKDLTEHATEMQLQTAIEQMQQNTRELQEKIMQMRMVPISTVFSRFPRLVHDLSKKLDKKIDLKLIGESTELDKTFVEKISDPMIHLVRNAIDHGLEQSDERIANGKPATGTVCLNAYHQGDNIYIQISDDGRGLDEDKIRKKAIEKSVISSDDNLSKEQLHNLIFHAGFSTADQVTDLSGRGVGLDVVKQNIQSLGGSVHIESQKGKGATFTVRLPLTLAVVEGQLFRVGKETYIIPVSSVCETVEIDPLQLSNMGGEKCELYRLRDVYIPVVRLYEVFGILSVPKTLADGMLIVVEAGSTKFGLFVDELLSQQQVVIKSLEEHYQRVDGLSGATILWNGHIALIVDVFGLASQVNSNIREFRKTWFLNYPIDMNGLSVHLSDAE